MNIENTNPYNRIEKIMKYFNLNPNSLAKAINLKRTQNLYDIRDGKVQNISHSLAHKIITEFTVINKDWLLTGNGTMFLTPIDEDAIYIQNLKEENKRLLSELEAKEREIKLLQKSVEDKERIITLMELSTPKSYTKHKSELKEMVK